MPRAAAAVGITGGALRVLACKSAGPPRGHVGAGYGSNLRAGGLPRLVCLWGSCGGTDRALAPQDSVEETTVVDWVPLRPVGSLATIVEPGIAVALHAGRPPLAKSASAAGLAALAAGCRWGLRWVLLLSGVTKPSQGWVIRGPPGPLGAAWEPPKVLLRDPPGGRSVRRPPYRSLSRPGGEGPQRGIRRGLLAPALPPVFFLVLWHVFRAAGGRVARGEVAGLRGRGVDGQRARSGSRGGASRWVTRPVRLFSVPSLSRWPLCCPALP